MKLIGIINVFNEARNIEKCITSVIDHFDSIHVWDGAYRQYPHDKPYSTDGTIEIVKRLADKNSKVVLHECTEAWEDQIVKRTAMFSVGEVGDYFVKIDGDEYITNPEDIRLAIATEQFDVGWAWTVSNLYPEPTMISRVFRYQKGMHYAGRHHWLFDKNNDLITSDQNMNPTFTHKDLDVRFFNFREKATNSDPKKKKEFLVKRNAYELAIEKETDVYKRACPLEPRTHRAGEFSKFKIDVVRVCENPKYTMSLMLSRPWAIDRFFNNLKQLDLPSSLEIVALVDSDQLWVFEETKKHLELDKRFDGVKVIYTGRPPLEEFGDVAQRRKRIAGNWNSILCEARGEILLGAEDDSLPQKDAYIKLEETMNKEGVDFVQGNIIGRWGKRLCPAWKVITINNKPQAVYNAQEQGKGIEPIQGCGWYCFVTTVDLMRKYPLYLDKEMPLGPDLRQGWELTKRGYKLLHQWDIKVEHFTEHDTIIIGNSTTEQRLMVKKKGEWEVIE